MPSGSNNATSSPISPDNQQSAPLYVELCPPIPRHHHYYNHQDAVKHQYNQIEPVPNLETIHEAKPLRHYWPYPASDLSSIYSNVLVTANGQFMRDSYGPSYTAPPMRHPVNSREYLLPPAEQHPRLSPISSLSSVTSPTSESSRRSHYFTRRDVEPQNVDSRSTASLSTPSSPAKSVPSIARSASADLLSSESEPFFPRGSEPRNPRNRKNSFDQCGNVSMRETNEIVENIERLLSS
uniref:Uncharacterized protein n=1 Tax=Ciona savignyi TaxID=51511 RepID=H2YUK8_CIOSA